MAFGPGGWEGGGGQQSAHAAIVTTGRKQRQMLLVTAAAEGLWASQEPAGTSSLLLPLEISCSSLVLQLSLIYNCFAVADAGYN